MKLTYLESASVIIEHNGIKILCDPWLVDGEYYGSWYHYPPVNFKAEKYNDVDYIYISHIHLDHYSPKTLKQISTGKEDDKFGVSENEFINLVKYSKVSKFIELKCLSVHIGSQILSHKPYAKMLKVIDRVINKTGYRFKFIDLGGGIGISYEKNNKNFNFKIFNNLISNFLKKHNSRIIFEPGRSIIGNSGILISKIIYIKKNKNKNFIILDAAMNDFMRKALYGANHQIIPSIKNGRILHKEFEFVGPICESTDKFLTLNKFQLLKEQDLIIICDVGAYGMSLASNYNVRPLPAEILVKNSSAQIIRNRQKLSDLI